MPYNTCKDEGIIHHSVVKWGREISNIARRSCIKIIKQKTLLIDELMCSVMNAQEAIIWGEERSEEEVKTTKSKD